MEAWSRSPSYRTPHTRVSSDCAEFSIGQRREHVDYLPSIMTQSDTISCNRGALKRRQAVLTK
jgi:hypothetical protein